MTSIAPRERQLSKVFHQSHREAQDTDSTTTSSSSSTFGLTCLQAAVESNDQQYVSETHLDDYLNFVAMHLCCKKDTTVVGAAAAVEPTAAAANSSVVGVDVVAEIIQASQLLKFRHDPLFARWQAFHDTFQVERLRSMDLLRQAIINDDDEDNNGTVKPKSAFYVNSSALDEGCKLVQSLKQQHKELTDKSKQAKFTQPLLEAPSNCFSPKRLGDSISFLERLGTSVIRQQYRDGICTVARTTTHSTVCVTHANPNPPKVTQKLAESEKLLSNELYELEQLDPTLSSFNDTLAFLYAECCVLRQALPLLEHFLANRCPAINKHWQRLLRLPEVEFDHVLAAAINDTNIASESVAHILSLIRENESIKGVVQECIREESQRLEAAQVAEAARKREQQKAEEEQAAKEAKKASKKK